MGRCLCGDVRCSKSTLEYTEKISNCSSWEQKMIDGV